MKHRIEAIRGLQAKAEEAQRLNQNDGGQDPMKVNRINDKTGDGEDASLFDGSLHQTIDAISLTGSDKGDIENDRPKAPYEFVRKETRAILYLRYFILLQIMSMGSIFGYGTFKVIQREELHETKVGSNISSPYEETSFLVESCDATGNETMVYSITDGESEYIKEMREIPQSVKDGATVLELDNHDNIFQTTSTSCNFRLWAIPSNLLANDGISRSLRMEVDKPKYHITMTVVVGSCFGLLLVAFLVYDYFIEKRQAIVINIATKSSAIVDGLFPAQVRDRMLDVEGDKINDKRKEIQRRNSMGDASRSSTVDLFSMDSSKWKRGGNQALQNAIVGPNNISIKQFLAGNEANAELAQQHFSDTPIADLFPNTTVIFADIAGFTAWSSQREPPQVFTLLETLYRSFDEVAGKLKVFKVETIGDSYMAVTGLPIPDQAHAVHMARFAYQCLLKMKNLTAELEAILGPGTSDLTLRVGLHSGAVTAGVLRGQKSRFQLFGDTVNTASRMESTGIREKIQVSQETADLLKAAGKSHWLKPREELVVAKGKGELKTFWLDPTKKKSKSGSIFVKSPKESVSARTPLGNANVPVPFKRRFDDKYIRLIDWNVDVLLHHLARLISCRSRTPPKGSLVRHSSEVALLPTSIDNVAEVIAFPPFDLHSARFRRARPDVSTLQQTRADLHEYVTSIVLMYQDVPFHNFEHASHVTLCANKLLNRLINSDEYDSEEALHNATFGISSDPLTHFAIVFAALIHDVDHTGIPNAQLVKDKAVVAQTFDNKSVAEQNSVHLGWKLLMDPKFKRLRQCIYQTNVERKRFRQLVINSILATDIADRKINEGRQLKWDRAFKRKATPDLTPMQIQDAMNRKATVVIEHIIQVSDVAHSMQHWHIYRRWNERLFHEMHDAFKTGRVAVDPSINWYIGEIAFFNHYLIPLAMKLKDCGVFGASGYEYVSYVLKNKKEWEMKGIQVIKEMVLLYKEFDETMQNNNVSLDSSYISYDSDDLEYDSPGDMSSDVENP